MSKKEQVSELDALQPPELERALFALLQRVAACENALQEGAGTQHQPRQEAEKPKD